MDITDLRKGATNHKAKCLQCGEKTKVKDMYVYKENPNKYVCGKKCFDEIMKEAEFKEKERQELDDLYEYVRSLHGMKTLPTSWFTMMQDLRNGTVRKQGILKKKYKNGVPYEVILEAYTMVRKKIEWAKNNKNFKDDSAELRYGFVIMESNVSRANKKMNKRRERKNDHNRQETGHPDTVHTGSYEYKKKSTNDISDLLE